jgi:tetratricopeptide (TPR) repeat protein
MRGLRSTLLLVLLALTSPRASLAEPSRGKPAARVEAPADVETAESLYGNLDYDKANDVAERVVKQRGLSHDQLVRAYRVLAVTYAVLGKEDQARDAFLRLLVLEPEYTVDTNLGPKVSTPFVEARGQFRTLPARPGIDVTANVRESGGQLRVVTRDPLHLTKKVSVGYRWTPSGDYVVATAPLGEGSVEVAAAPAGRTRLDYYAIALDDRDNVVLEAGSPQAPRSAFADAVRPPSSGRPQPEPDNGRSVLSRPLFWVLAGAAVVGGGAAAFFALRPEDAPTRASLTPELQCGPYPCR